MADETQQTQQTPTPPVPGVTEGYVFGSFMDDPKNAGFDNDGDEGQTFDNGGEGEETPREATNTNSSKTPIPATEDVQFKGIKPEIVDLIKQVASNGEFDLANPKEFKAARQIAEKEQQIRDLKKSGEPSPAAKNYLDAFNDPEPQQPSQQQQQQQQGEPDEPPPHVKLAREWKTPSDFTTSLYDAFNMDDGPEKNAAVSNVMLGFVDRTMHELYFPRIHGMVNHLQQQHLGPVVDEVQQSRQAAERRGVVDTLATQDGFSDIHSLFEPASDGKIQFEGEMIPDTWLNRVLVAHPHILQIEVKGKTPRESERKTLAARYTAAHRLMKVQRAEKTDPATANGLIRTGRAIEQSKRDPVRTGLNAGKAGVPSGGRKESIFGNSGGEITMASLFGS